MGFTLFVVINGLIVAFFVGSSIKKSLANIAKIHDFGSDLTKRLEVEGSDEIALLAKD